MNQLSKFIDYTAIIYFCLFYSLTDCNVPSETLQEDSFCVRENIQIPQPVPSATPGAEELKSPSFTKKRKLSNKILPPRPPGPPPSWAFGTKMDSVPKS